MISVNDLRAGVTFKENGVLFKVLSFEHIKMGRGSANVKTKVINLRSGAITEKGYTSGVVVQNIDLTKKDVQFLYKDSDNAYFMNPKTFDQISVPLKKLLGHKFLKEGENISLEFYDEEPLDLLLPPKVTLKIKDTDPGIRGNSASNVYKDAVLENNMRIRVPLFIEVGDSVVVDTRDGSYTRRA